MIVRTYTAPMFPRHKGPTRHTKRSTSSVSAPRSSLLSLKLTKVDIS